MTDVDYADDQTLLANTPAQIESQLYCLYQSTGAIGLYVNANKTEFIHVKQGWAICTLRGKSLKSVDQFTYLDCNISSTEMDVNTHPVKVWTPIDRLSTIWKAAFPDKIRRNFVQSVTISVLLYGCTTRTLMKLLTWDFFDISTIKHYVNTTQSKTQNLYGNTKNPHR